MSSEKTLKWVFFGKGGIGKSTIASAVCCELAGLGRKVLRVGCDPKKDSSAGLLGSQKAVSFSDLYCGGEVREDQLIMRTAYGVDCVEAGGPEPGVGCAGRGVSLLLEHMKETRLAERLGYDAVVYDVLGDVVCGGFAAPMRMNFAEKAFIVLGNDLMSMLAANNIAKAVSRYSANGVSLGGLLVNRVGKRPHGPLLAFSKALNTRIVGAVPEDLDVLAADFAGKPMAAYGPDSPFSRALKVAVKNMLALKACPKVKPMNEEEFSRFKLAQAAGMRA